MDAVFLSNGLATAGAVVVACLLQLDDSSTPAFN
jgi:hypothetical protein